jgi:mRNA interferase RelE/StbE
VTYTVTVLPGAKREVPKIDSPDFAAVSEKLLALGENPRPHGCKKLRGRNGWRIRVGNYPVIYEIDDARQTIIVLNVGHRKDIYA